MAERRLFTPFLSLIDQRPGLLVACQLDFELLKSLQWDFSVLNWEPSQLKTIEQDLDSFLQEYGGYWTGPLSFAIATQNRSGERFGSEDSGEI